MSLRLGFAGASDEGSGVIDEGVEMGGSFRGGRWGCRNRRVGFRGTGRVSPALAQSVSVKDLNALQGADRAQKLAEGAKKEGMLSLYTSLPVDDMKAFTDAFEKKFGVKTTVWRASAEQVLQRVVQEHKAGRYDVDAFELGGQRARGVCIARSCLAEVKSPYLADLMPQALPPHREFIGTRINLFAAAYNTNLVKPADLPKSMADLADPKWKGKLGIEVDDPDWFADGLREIGEEKGLKIFRDIATTNGFSVRRGHTLLTNLVVSGEVPFALTVYSYKAEQLKNNGAPLGTLYLAPAVARVNGVGVARKAPRPHAAALFAEFMLTEGQEIMKKRDFLPTSRKHSALKLDQKIIFVDPAKELDEGDKWAKAYKEIINTRPR